MLSFLRFWETGLVPSLFTVPPALVSGASSYRAGHNRLCLGRRLRSSRRIGVPVDPNDPRIVESGARVHSSGRDEEKVIRGYVTPDRKFPLDPLL